MNDRGGILCSHCLLPVGIRAMQRTVNGESHAFCCYGCCIAFQVKNGKSEEWEAAWLLIRLGVGGFLSMNIMLFSLLLYAGAFTGVDARLLPWIHLLLWVFATPALIILGGPFLAETWRDAVDGRVTSSALIVLGVGAAYLYSAFAVVEHGPHVYFDTASMVLMLFTVGRYLEAAGRARAARNLEPLLAAESECATVVDGSVESRRPVREVGTGTLVQVRSGERIPLDGTVMEGESHADEAVITGESRLVPKGVGSPVIAGSINMDGPLLIRSTRAGTDTRWAQICRSVRDALTRRSPTQRLADRVVGIFVPLVLTLGALTTLCWAQWLPFDRALLIGLAVLVIACPCAVGLAAPLATSLGIGRLARRGCLVREPGALEDLARTRLLALDKTGTLTSGRPHVVRIETDEVVADQVLARAAGLERHSEHGFGRAITAAAAARGLDPEVVRNVRILPGRGIRGSADGQAVVAGNGALMSELGWSVAPALGERGRSLEAEGYSVIYVGWGEHVRAALALDDAALPEARWTVEALRNRGLHVILLSGDLAHATRGQAGCSAPTAPKVRCGCDGRRRPQRRAGARRSGYRNRRRFRDRSRSRNSRRGLASGWVVDAAVGRRCGARGSHDDPHQPAMGVWVQPDCADPCRARPVAAGPCGCGDGRLEHSRGAQFTPPGKDSRSRLDDVLWRRRSAIRPRYFPSVALVGNPAGLNDGFSRRCRG